MTDDANAMLIELIDDLRPQIEFEDEISPLFFRTRGETVRNQETGNPDHVRPAAPTATSPPPCILPGFTVDG